jgi:DNA-binding transcriptional ArsR family regulator
MQSGQHSPFVVAYLRWLQAVSVVQSLPVMDGFGVEEKALFEAIMLGWAQNSSLTVQQAISIEELGSPSTLHKRLSRLREMELITAECVDGNRRTKFLVPSIKGLEYAESLGRACLQSIEASAQLAKS